jgi:VacB/RNase II family 3'-5' exoribonuclease
VAIADVDALVARDTPIDRHALTNTTTIYTAAGIFPMLPVRLSNDLTSLNQDADRRAVVVAFDVDDLGALGSSEVFEALVRNKAKLAYRAVAAWLDGRGDMPPAMRQAAGVAEQIRLQDQLAARMRQRRHEHGALDLETLEPRAQWGDSTVTSLALETKTRAHELIEDFMVAANIVTTRFLTGRGFATFRRVVRVPDRWDRIQAVAASLGERLPDAPDARALSQFLVRRRKADPLRFPDLSVTIVKLIGSGEYVVHRPKDVPIGHFGLAVRDYTHSTAPNRRYPDVITQRTLKAALEGRPAPYRNDSLARLAKHCTETEDAVKKVERQVLKSAAALLLQPHLGEKFDGLVTGASYKGTWVRILQPPVEGKVVHGADGLDVGDRVRVRLVSVDVERGFIDFAALA